MDRVQGLLLKEQFKEFSQWVNLIPFAEEQGMAPLFYFHCRKAGLDIPEAPRRQLQALTLRHRQANQIRTDLLTKIITACEKAGVQLILLKGAALFHLVYPEPGLRPMRDLDLLVHPSQAPVMETLLGDLGFTVPPAELKKPRSSKHLPALTSRVSGYEMTLEVHFSLIEEEWDPGQPLVDDLMARARPFSFEGLTAHTLALEDMFRHIYRHMAVEQARLIALTDLINISEQFEDEMDWERLIQMLPSLQGILSLFHCLSPLSEKLVKRFSIKPGEAPKDIGQEFKGWPRITFRQWKNLGLWGFLKETLFPSEWWLHLYYGLAPGRSLFTARWVKHPLFLFKFVLRRLYGRLASKVSLPLIH